MYACMYIAMYCCTARYSYVFISGIVLLCVAVYVLLCLIDFIESAKSKFSMGCMMIHWMGSVFHGHLEDHGHKQSHISGLLCQCITMCVDVFCCNGLQCCRGFDVALMAEDSIVHDVAEALICNFVILSSALERTFFSLHKCVHESIGVCVHEFVCWGVCHLCVVHV